MPLSTAQCQQINDYLGRRPFNWDKQIAKDRKPHSYIYTGMYKTSEWPKFAGTTRLHERVYVARANDPGMWQTFVADPCVGAPCDIPRKTISHGVDQIRYDHYRTTYTTMPFCLDQLNAIEEVETKMAAIVEGYKDIPEEVVGSFLRQLAFRKAGNVTDDAGAYLVGVADSLGNPVGLSISDNMFAISQGQSPVNSNNTLLINLNANGDLTANSLGTTALLAAALGKMTMEYLGNFQEDLAANGYHDREWAVAGKFHITMDATTRRGLLAANPALTGMYQASDFSKGGMYYSYGVTAGCGDWVFKQDDQQWRFRFRNDLDGKDLNGNALANAVWIEQVQPYENVAATFGLKPRHSAAWKAAPIRIYHCYNRDAREIFVGDIGSVNDEMKFGLARSFMGKWSWKSPDYFDYTDPNTGVKCTYMNDLHNRGYWVGEYDLGAKTVYPEIERWFIGLGEAQPFARVPRTNTAPTGSSTYQSILAYNSMCGDSYVNPNFVLPNED